MVRTFSVFLFYSILLSCICLFSKFSSAHLLGNETDRLALLSIKSQITSDPSNVTTFWNESNHFCEWEGISCSRKHQRVSVLNLSSLHLVGHISPHIGNLSFLKIIDLSANDFSGDIPPEIGRLFRLRVLFVANNSLQGISANVSFCSNLNKLVLYNNQIGKLPMEIVSLRNLLYFDIYNNMLEGSIPPAFGNLTSLWILEFSYNSLDGSIPSTLGNLKELRYLGFGLNDFSGMLPPSLYNLSNLKLFGFSGNRLTGSLPINIGFMLPNIIELVMGKNLLYGPLPSSLFNASKLQRFDISQNQFIGDVSLNVGNLGDLHEFNLADNEFGSGKVGDLDFITPLTNCSNLQFFSVSRNHFGGTLPTSVANFSKQLYFLNFYRNKISGNIPNEIDNLQGLTLLRLSLNFFTGSIPRSFKNMQNLRLLDLNFNNLSGSVPSFTRNMSNLYHLSLGNNFLEGSISPVLENPFLQELDLADNYFSSTLPKEIGRSSRLLRLNLTNNFLNGSIPLEIGDLVHLFEFSIARNNISGEIPKTLVDCSSLQILYLNNNSLEGALPESLDVLKDLRNVDVSHNNLSGKIPEEMERLSALTSLDLSFNNFEGEMPMEGIFRNASAFSVAGNQNICGGIPKLGLPKCHAKRHGKRGTSVPLKVLLGVLIPSVVVTVLLVLSSRKKSTTNASSEECPADLWRVSYNDLHKATSGFSSANLLGSGRYGSVYKGVSRQGNLIAVKVLNLQEPGAFRNFVAECETLRVARHRNLLKIYTVCSSVDFSGNDFKALVFQFMPNGNLDNLLHPSSEREGVPKSLSFAQRLNVAIDVASGLDYLHNHGEIPIVHCDLKASNVLLDDELCAHVADFGLAKFLPMTDMTNTLNSIESSSISIRGTIGYIPPEYGAGVKVSTQGDMYSFGILLLEMFTGMRPTDCIFKDGLNLHDFSRKMLTQEVMEIIDMSMLSNIHDEPTILTNELKECLILIMRIGLACSMGVPAERMTITDALKELHSIKRKFLSSMPA